MERELKIALAGNPNCGKTTLFNALTGSNQFVGNWPGVTVEKKEGKLKGHKTVTIMDLPGIYSLSPYTMEEVIARNYLIGERPDAILNIIDGTNLERNLYLTTQLTELGIPVVVAVNMMDVVRKNGDKINCQELGRELGCDVVEISALKGDGITAAAEAAVKAAQETTTVPMHTFAGPVEHALAHIEEAAVHNLPAEQQRWYAIKLFERDDKVLEQLALPKAVLDHIESDIAAAEAELDDDAESIITNERYLYIASILKGCYQKKRTGGLTVSDKIDRVVTSRFAALPIFAAVMVLVYFISVTTVGTWVTDWTNDGLFGDGFHLFGMGSSEYSQAMDEHAQQTLWTREMVATVEDAAQAGVIGAEDLLAGIEDGDFAAFDESYGTYADALAEAGYDISGYYDAAMETAPDTTTFGVWVPGVPVLVEDGLTAIGCADWLQSLILDGIVAGVGAVLGFVPQMLVLFLFLAFLESCGYMARIAFVMDRIFRRFGLSGKSFIPCGAKLPIISLIAVALFGGAWWMGPSAYFLGIAAIVISGIMLKKTRPFAGEPAPFVMELPAYHLPTVSNLLRSVWERGWSFIKRAGTIILLASIVIWAGSSFGVVDGVFLFDPEMALESSILGILGSAICWIFSPLGFGSIKATVATIMGLVAKEEVVGVFGVLDFEGMTPLAGYAFLAFNLLCAPCFAAIGAIRREMNSPKWTWFAIGYQCGFAYVVSLIIYQLGLLFTGSVNVIGLIIALFFLGLILFQLFRPYQDAKTLRTGKTMSRAGT